MPQQNDLFVQTEDALLAERLMKTPAKGELLGLFRTSEALVNAPLVVELLVGHVGARNIIEFCVTTMERQRANEKS